MNKDGNITKMKNLFLNLILGLQYNDWFIKPKVLYL